VQGLGSALVLNGVLLVGLLVALPNHGGNPLYVSAFGVGAAVVVVAAALWLAIARQEERTVRLARLLGRRLPHLSADGLEQAVRRSRVRIDELTANPGLLLQAALWASANWLLDAASLWVFLAAFGHRVGLANMLAVLPLSPGGLGIIEGVLIPSLIGFGTPRTVATLGVLAWRLFNFWAPIPAGGAAWLSLRLNWQKEQPAPASG
jgi:uncharacterized membrane protein YbhN (UPF0104 family)